MPIYEHASYDAKKGRFIRTPLHYECYHSPDHGYSLKLHAKDVRLKNKDKVRQIPNTVLKLKELLQLCVADTEPLIVLILEYSQWPTGPIPSLSISLHPLFSTHKALRILSEIYTNYFQQRRIQKWKDNAVLSSNAQVKILEFDLESSSWAQNALIYPIRFRLLEAGMTQEYDPEAFQSTFYLATKGWFGIRKNHVSLTLCLFPGSSKIKFLEKPFLTFH